MAVKVFVYTEGGEEKGLRAVKALLGHLPLFLELETVGVSISFGGIPEASCSSTAM